MALRFGNLGIGKQQAPAQPTGQAKAKVVVFRTIQEEKIAKNPDAAPVAPVIYPEVSDTDFCIPHIKAKPSLGLTMSGGGYRAATCAVGWARGLHNTKLPDGSTALSKARYLSTTSGGSWFNAPFTYKAVRAGETTKDVPLDTFLGTVMQPSELTLAYLKTTPPPGSFDNTIAVPSMLDSFLASMAGAWVPFAKSASALQEAMDQKLKEVFQKTDQAVAARGKPLPDWVAPWTKSISQTFLAPYGLNVFENFVLGAANTKGHIYEDRLAANGGTGLMACTDVGRPYPIFMGTAFNPPGDDGYSTYPYEFTPLYFGTPGAFPRSSPPLGGGYVEPLGLHAVPKSGCTPNGIADGSCITGEIEIDRSGVDPKNKRPMHPVPLAQTVAISSSFLAAAAYDKSPVAQKLASTEQLVNWSVLPLSDGAPASTTIGFADGGMVDNLGISALLRRRVRCMIVMAACSAPPDDTWEKYAAEGNDVSSWFGAATACLTPEMTATELNDRCQVFGKNRREGIELFQDLFEDVHQKLRTGRPGFHRATYKVYENTYHNIPAYDEVEVLWIFNHQWAGWEDQLPKETYARLQADRKGPNNKDGVHHKTVMPRKFMEGELSEGPQGFMKQNNLYRFPYFTTFSLDLNNEAVHMLSQLSTAVIMHPEVQQHIQELVEIASKE